MRLPRPSRLPRPPRPPLRAVAGFALVLVAVTVGWLWLRDSSLVAVERVTVTGASGPDAHRVRQALEGAARDMTTLHVRDGALRTAVEPFPAVRGVTTRSDFPHVLRIEVHERVPVAAIVARSVRVAVAADGTLLRTTRTADLPAITARSAPAGAHVTDRRLLRSIGVVAAAPVALRARVDRVFDGPRGVTMPLRDGPDLLFGSAGRLRAKWAATAVVLADSSSRGAGYVDVRLPERPVAGGLEEIAADEDPTTDDPTPVAPQATTPAATQPLTQTDPAAVPPATGP
jgi:cell division protein FtsQ